MQAVGVLVVVLGEGRRVLAGMVDREILVVAVAVAGELDDFVVAAAAVAAVVPRSPFRLLLIRLLLSIRLLSIRLLSIQLLLVVGCCCCC